MDPARRLVVQVGFLALAALISVSALAAGRKGSKRVGGTNKAGKGSKYVGGKKKKR